MKQKSVFKRLLSIVCVVVLLCSCIACNPKTPSNHPNNPNGSPEPEPSRSIPIFQDGEFTVTLVRSDQASDEEKKALSRIGEALNNIYGKKPKQTTDFEKNESAYEILIGRTGYGETKAVADTLSYGEYSVCVEGNKIVLYTHVIPEISYVATQFINFLKENGSAEKNELLFSESDEIRDSIHRDMQNYPVYTDALPTAYETSDASAYQFLFLKRSAESVDAYSQTLLENGYSVVSDCEVVGIRYRTYRSATGAVTTSFTKSDGTLRLILEPEKNLFVQNDNSYTAITTPQLIMFGDYYGSINGYMGFLIRLSDGRFLVIDGGFNTNGFADKIYNTMVKQSGGKTDVTVAAWIFTHSHGDHVGGFLTASERYSEHIKVERFIYNFASQASAKAIEPGAANSAVQTISHIEQYYPNAIVNKCHTGQVYEIADAKIEIYYTPDEYLTATRKMADAQYFNSTSIIFSVNIGGQRIMFLGDAETEVNNETAARYGSYLKSDFVQVAHHGGRGGTAAIYREIDAQVALFTTDDSRILSENGFLSSSYNKALINNPNLKEYYNAHNRVTIFDLPYTPTGSGFMR